MYVPASWTDLCSSACSVPSPVSTVLSIPDALKDVFTYSEGRTLSAARNADIFSRSVVSLFIRFILYLNNLKFYILRSSFHPFFSL